MSRSPREDRRGVWWHIYNRGLAKRAVYETRQDVERFLDLLGAATATGRLEIHAFTLLTTHYHLLARSPRGEISQAMQQVGNSFVRWFNRTRRRDGPLFRGRFGGRRIDDGSYWLTLLRYIDLNAPRAGICALPSDHLYGSARLYRQGAAPAWLSRDAVEGAFAEWSGGPAFRGEDYDRFATSCDPEFDAHLVERLIRRPSLPSPRFADLVRAASLHEQNWMQWKAALADGTVPGMAFLSPDAARRAARAASRVLRGRDVPAGRSDVHRDLELALLRTAAGLDLDEAAALHGVGCTTVHEAVARHRRRLAGDPAYEALVNAVLRNAVRRSIPKPTRAFGLPMRVDAGAAEALVVPLGVASR